MEAQKENSLKEIYILIRNLKKEEDSDREEKLSAEIIFQIDKLEIPSDDQGTVKLYNDLKSLKKRSESDVPSEIADALFKKMGSVVGALKTRPGSESAASGIEKDFKNIKMQNYYYMALGALVIAAILYWIFGSQEL